MYEWVLTTQVEDKQEPLIVAEALKSVHWREAIEKEYKSLIHNNIWELVSLSSKKTIISGKWCY